MKVVKIIKKQGNKNLYHVVVEVSAEELESTNPLEPIYITPTYMTGVAVGTPTHTGATLHTSLGTVSVADSSTTTVTPSELYKKFVEAAKAPYMKYGS